MPAPFGLIRYGVAPDHPRIKGIVTALHKVLDKPQVRLLGNIDYGADITLDDLRRFYDAVIFSTGANADRALDIPGIDLDGSYGAADFVSWYDGHPDVPRAWPLQAEKVAVLGVGNVALDVARVLAKTGDELLPTEIPPNVYAGLWPTRPPRCTCSAAAARRRPSSPRWNCANSTTRPPSRSSSTPRTSSTTRAPRRRARHSKQVDMVANTLQDWAIRDVGDRPHKLFLHFFESPTEILGEDGKVVGLRTERTELDGTGNVTRHRQVQRLGRAGRLPRGRLPVAEHHQPALRRAGGHRPERGRPRGGRRLRRRPRAALPASDLRHRAGSSAARSA